MNKNNRCDSKIVSIIRIPDKSKLFECDFPDCFKIFDSYEKLGIHRYSIHNIQVENSIISKYNSIVLQKNDGNNFNLGNMNQQIMLNQNSGNNGVYSNNITQNSFIIN